MLWMALWALTAGYAHEGHECFPSLPEFAEFQQVHNAISTNFATEAELARAPCLRRTPYTTGEIQQWLDRDQGAGRYNRTVNGVAFEQESEENLQAFKQLTTAVDRFGGRDLKRNLVFSSDCKKVACAVRNLFGPQVGPQLLFMQRKFGLNGSHLVARESAPWTKQELDTVLLGLSDLPPGVLPLAESKPFRKSSRPSTTTGGVGVSANSVIEVFDVWNRLPHFTARSTLVHEIGHSLADVTGLDESERWKSLSGWRTTNRIVDGEKQTVSIASRPTTMVSQYGGTDPWEDFAESVKAYRYGPEKLLQASPQKYALIRQTIFNNVEYRSEAHCESPAPYSETMWQSAVNRYRQWSPSAAEMRQIVSFCHGRAIEKIYESERVDLTSPQQQACYRQGIQKFMKSSMASNRHLAPMVRNMRDIPISASVMGDFLRQAPVAHRALLRENLKTAFATADHFNPLCREGKLSRFSRAFPATAGFVPSQSANELQAIAVRSCETISDNGSLRRLLPLDFGEDELEAHVANLVK